MSETKETTSLEHHEKIAKDTFNKTWDYIENKERTAEEDLSMIHAAHTSIYHWSILVNEGKGTPLNLQRGEWLLSRVYTILKRGESASYHAKICLNITEKNKIGDFDLAFAYESVARSSALLKDNEEFKKYFKLANEAGEKIKSKDDKDYFLEELKGGNWFGLK
ncbi:MAG: hypothetical protein ACW986_17280 [Promethearchaeota archaeon]|jgi:hypothetical protein